MTSCAGIQRWSVMKNPWRSCVPDAGWESSFAIYSAMKGPEQKCQKVRPPAVHWILYGYLYKYGYEDGRESVPGVDLEEVMAAVAVARGVGKRTLDNIRDCVEQLFRKEDENE